MTTEKPTTVPNYLELLGLGQPLRIVGLVDAGVPNSERIVLRPARAIGLRGYGIAVGFPIGIDEAVVLHDNVFWFPDMLVEPPAWLFVYTGKGVTRQTTMTSGEPALVFHWHRERTVFNVKELVPVVFQTMNIHVGKRLP